MIDKQKLDEELADCSSELLQYIYDSQKELYSEEELEYILKRKEIQLAKEAKEQKELEAEAKKYLPKEIDCPKCGGPNEFKRDTCKFCGATLNKDSYHEHALNLALGIADEVEPRELPNVEEEPEGESHVAQYIVSFVLPFVGWIMGGILMTKEDPAQRSVGLNCIVIGIVSGLLSFIVFMINVKATLG